MSTLGAAAIFSCLPQNTIYGCFRVAECVPRVEWRRRDSCRTLWRHFLLGWFVTREQCAVHRVRKKEVSLFIVQYIVTALKIIAYNNIICFCLQTSKTYLRPGEIETSGLHRMIAYCL